MTGGIFRCASLYALFTAVYYTKSIQSELIGMGCHIFGICLPLNIAGQLNAAFLFKFKGKKDGADGPVRDPHFLRTAGGYASGRIIADGRTPEVPSPSFG